MYGSSLINIGRSIRIYICNVMRVEFRSRRVLNIMDLLGEIVERVVEEENTEELGSRNNVGGFPELYRPTKISSWKQRLREKSAKKQEHETRTEAKPARGSEAVAIHNENIRVLQGMSEEDIMRERQELLESFDPKLLKNLLNNINKRAGEEGTPLFAEIEGAPGTWVGGTSSLNDLVPMNDNEVDKALGVMTEEDPEDKLGEIEQDKDEVLATLDDDDVAPLDFQMAQSIDHMSNEELLNDVHFVTHNDTDEECAKQFERLDMNDPAFNDKLHKKFFPDLPKDVEKLKWMEPLDGLEKPQLIDDVSQCRFDFNGNMVPPTREVTSTTHTALHHHSDDPHLAGYTIPELQRLSRSSFSGQRSIAIQTFGRILYKLGKQSYYQLVPEVDVETYQEHGSSKEVVNKIYGMFWDLCKDCRIIECLQEAADEKKTRHLSVRNYALDALWLWKKGGGDFREQ